jgi:tripartite-type tricarboxylate transporter receptor subunit TctC
VIVPAISKKPPYDPTANFEPIGLVGSAPITLIAKTGLPVKNLTEFASYIKANPGKLSYGSAGIGSQSHYGCVMLLSSLKAEATHVPYRGVAPAMTDLMGGQIDFMCDQPTATLQQIQAGKVKGIAVLGNQKLTQMPALQTAASQGFKDTNVRVWTGLFAPKGTSPEVIKRLNDAMTQATQTTELKTQAKAGGLDLPDAYFSSPGALSAMIVLGGKRDAVALQARKEYLD